MKNVILLPLLLLSVLSCEKNIEPMMEEELFEKDEDFCYLNVCDWEGYTSLSLINGDSEWEAKHCWFGNLNNGTTIIHLSRLNDACFLREDIRIANVALELGKVKISSNWPFVGGMRDSLQAIFDTYVADGDAGSEQYRLYEIENFDHYLEIDFISESRNIIEGSYQLYFVLDPNGPPKLSGPERPDTLIFTNGRFRAGKFF